MKIWLEVAAQDRQTKKVTLAEICVQFWSLFHEQDLFVLQNYIWWNLTCDGTKIHKSYKILENNFLGYEFYVLP